MHIYIHMHMTCVVVAIFFSHEWLNLIDKQNFREAFQSSSFCLTLITHVFYHHKKRRDCWPNGLLSDFILTITKHISYSVQIKFKCLSFSGSKDILFYSFSKERCSSLKITQGWDSSFDDQDWLLEKFTWKLLED